MQPDPIVWLCPPAADNAPVEPPKRRIMWFALAGVTSILLWIGIVVAVIWTLASIHATTAQACPTMDAACQVQQESPE
jgi:hypothetical protein